MLVNRYMCIHHCLWQLHQWILMVSVNLYLVLYSMATSSRWIPPDDGESVVNLPTLRQLRHLVALADHGHFGRAAAQCAITQSTLSASLKELEDLLGAPLVDRTRRGMALTPLGREIVDRARFILAEAEALVELATARREPLSGRLHLGVIPTIGPFLLPRLWPVLRARHPRLTVYLIEDLTARLIDDVRSGRLDAALIALPYAVGHGVEDIIKKKNKKKDN
jgi:DNA-binding transcriptional LysR family regulator